MNPDSQSQSPAPASVSNDLQAQSPLFGLIAPMHGIGFMHSPAYGRSISDGIVGKRVVLIDERDSTSSSSALESPSVSNNHPNGNEDNFVGEDNENEDDAARERERRAICKQLYLAVAALESGRPPMERFQQLQLMLCALERMNLA